MGERRELDDVAKVSHKTALTHRLFSSARPHFLFIAISQKELIH